MSEIDLSLIITCYNEGETFEKSVGEIIKVLENLKLKWEIIFVEDKSQDATKASIEKFTSKIKSSKAIYHLKNEGRGKSVRDGFLAAKGRICGYIDVDCEISPSYIKVFIGEIESGYDVAIANRFYENKTSAILRLIFSKTYSWVVSWLLHSPFEDTEAGFKFFRRSKILPVIKKTRDQGWFFDTEICMLAYFAGLKIGQVPVLFVRREDKRSTVKLIPDSIEYLKKLFEFRSKYKKELLAIK